MSAAPGNIPHVGEVLSRPRLFGMMDTPCRIVLVTGQAAQGKTTLVADYLANQDAPSRWFHLNRAASDHGVLFDLIFRGLERLDSEFSQGANPPHIILGSRKDLLRQIEILVTAMGQLKHPLNLVMDDLESLDTNGSAFEFIEALLQEAPDQVRFFLLSRTQPPMNLSRFLMKRQLLALTNEDLAFTRDETFDFFKHPQGTWASDQSMLEEGDIDKIQAATEGWAGGLVLVSETMRISPNLGQLPDRLSAEAFSYFSHEIYLSLPGELRDFLMETALFDELDTRILNVFFSDLDPVQLLDRLERRNLFVRKICPHPTRPVFKYNNLFRDFLAADLKAARTEDELRALNKRAGQIYWEERDHDKAIDFFMAAGDFDKIAQIIRIKGADDLITGRAERLVEWISGLPEDMTQNDPWLIFFVTAARRIKGGKANITAFSQALSLFRSREDLRGTLLCLAYLIEAAVFIRLPPDAILKWIRQGEEQLASLKGKQRYTWARTLLWQQIGLGYITGNGDIPKGISACRNAMLLARGINNRDLLLNASVILTLGFVQSGDFSGARDMLDKISTFTGEERFPEYRALNNITNIDFALKRGDTALAGRLLEETEADIEKFGLIFLYPGFVEAKAIFNAGKGQFDQALQTADHLSDFSILEGNDFYLGIAHRIKAVTYLFKGQYKDAVQEGESAVQDLGRLMRGDIHLNLAKQVLALSLFHAGDNVRARQILEPVYDYFKVIGSDLSFCETAFIMGLIAVEQGEDAAHWFTQGLEKAEDNRYLNFPLMDDALLAKVFVASALAGVLPGKLAPYFKTIRSPRLPSAVTQRICSSLEQAAKKKRGALALSLADLYKAAQPKVLIRTLGPFRVSIGSRDLDPSLFGGSKPLLLLKAMVFKGGQDIPKEVLIDTLWPKSGAAAGEKNLKINLHRLRKALEPQPVKAFGYVYISQKSGLVSLEPDLVRLDTQAFADAYDAGCRLEIENDVTGAMDEFGKALDFYRGEYFADDLYLEWVGHHREFYRHKCIDTFARRAQLHLSLGQWQAAVSDWKGVLSLDSCHEEAYRNLMQLHGEAGLKGDVIRIFDQCKAALKSDLDAEPGDETVEMFNKWVCGRP